MKEIRDIKDIELRQRLEEALRVCGKDLDDLLAKNGYFFASVYTDHRSDSIIRSTTYQRKTRSLDLSVPLGLIEKALSEIGPYSVAYGSYSVSLEEEFDKSRDIRNCRVSSYTYFYQLHSKGQELPVWVVLNLSGRMSGLFPWGEVESCNIDANLYIGPVPMGKGQKARSDEMVKKAILSVPSFVEAFPEADVYAVWETRGGRGGWMVKHAHRFLGKAKEVFSRYRG